MSWNTATYQNQGLTLSYEKAGAGVPLIFLHGGPGDDHTYLRPFAEPFLDKFQCILPDQRGSGKSKVTDYNPEVLHLSKFIEDIEVLRVHLKQESLNIVGHSWGASLGLYYGLTHPSRINRLALIGMGPIDEEMTAVYQANLFGRFTQKEQSDLKRLREKRNEAAKGGNEEEQRKTHIELVTRFFSRAWIYSESARETFFYEYPSLYSYNRKVSLNLMPSVAKFNIKEALPKLKAPVLIMYGYQDIEPIAQAFHLQNHLTNASVQLINECGHLPWLDQSKKCQHILKTFLTENTNANH